MVTSTHWIYPLDTFIILHITVISEAAGKFHIISDDLVDHTEDC